MKISIINSKKTFSKIPSSPFSGEDEDKFIFETKEVQDIEEVYRYLQNNFLLNIPLKKTTKTYRRRESLKEHFVDHLEYLFIDIDHIKSISDRELIVKFFKDHNYKCIIGESRNPLNLKGVLQVSCNQQQAKQIVKEIDEVINTKYAVCDYDTAVYGMGTFQAPTHKDILLYKNLNGIVYPTPAHTPVIMQKSQPIQVKEIQDICRNIFIEKGYVFHDNEAKEFIPVSHYSEKKSPKGFWWYPDNPFLLHHFNKKRNLNIWEEVIKTKEYKDILQNIHKQELKSILPKPEYNTNEKYLNPHKEEVQEFLSYKNSNCILKVQSPMGTGKSVIIEEIINQSRKNNQRVLFLTNRISLADDIANKYADIKHYLGTELEGNKYNIGDDLVCQIDSLHKFSTKYFDVVIMDEFSTTMEHLLSIKNYQKNISTKIFSLYKKKLAVLDAFIFDDHLKNFITKNTKLIQINNKYRNDTQLVFYHQKDKFVFDLIQTAKKEPITVSSGSIILLKILEFLLKQNNISYFTISAETTQEVRKQIYKSLNQNKPKYQVFMYSPTITVGISNENDVYKHFHYDTSQSMGVLQSIQMIKRTRKAKEINIYISEKPKYLKTKTQDIQKDLVDFANEDEDGDIIGITETGIKMSRIIKVSNILENRHKESFLQLLKYQFTLKNNIKKITESVTPFVRKISKIIKLQEQEKKINVFKKYREMSPEKISEIEFKMFNTTPEEEYIKEFEYYRNDEILQKYIKDEEILKDLILYNIKDNGLIESFISIYPSYNIKFKPIMGLNDFKRLGIHKNDIKKYGYTKQRGVNRYFLKPELKEIIKRIKK